MLMLDQLCALIAIITTVRYYGLPRTRPVIVALGLLFLSETTKGLPFAIYHSAWHMMAFGIADELVRGTPN